MAILTKGKKMDKAEEAAIIADLSQSICELNHGVWNCEDIRAVEVLVIPMGHKINETEEVVVRELTIPICKECAETLYSNDKEWVLFLCTNCSSSAWKIRELLPQQYDSDILQLMRYCPYCYDQWKLEHQ